MQSVVDHTFLGKIRCNGMTRVFMVLNGSHAMFVYHGCWNANVNIDCSFTAITTCKLTKETFIITTNLGDRIWLRRIWNKDNRKWALCATLLAKSHTPPPYELSMLQ